MEIQMELADVIVVNYALHYFVRARHRHHQRRGPPSRLFPSPSASCGDATRASARGRTEFVAIG